MARSNSITDVDPTRDEFLGLLRASGLVAPERFREILDVSRESDLANDARALADRLIERGFLTAWQANEILNARVDFRIGDYVLLDQLGAGGMGTVYRARHVMFGRVVAIKVIAANLMTDTHTIARFQREMEIAISLKHPNLVAAYDADCVGRQKYLVLEYVTGKSLEDWITRYGKVPIDFACECIRQAALGLEYAHQKSLVHRDLKPANLMVTWPNGQGTPLVKVLDMGLARVGGKTELTQSGQFMGTPDYVAPEQAWDAKRADHRSDIFSLGCTLFEMLTGELPWEGEAVEEKLVARTMRDARRLKELLPSAPDELDVLLASMLSREPVERPETMAEVARRLAPFSNAAESESAVEAGDEVVAEPRSKRPSQTLSRHSEVTALASRAAVEGMEGFESADEAELLRPTLAVGIGKLGIRCLARLGYVLGSRAEPIPPYRPLAVDMDAEVLREVAAIEGDALPHDALFHCRLQKPNHYAERWDKMPHLATWLRPESVHQVQVGGRSGGVRALGRLALVENHRRLWSRLGAEIEPLLEGQDNAEPIVHVFAGMGGGTGSGMAIDLCYMLRIALAEMGVVQPDVRLYLISCVDPSDHARDLRKVNHFALLEDMLERMKPDYGWKTTYAPDVAPQEWKGPFASAVYWIDAQSEEQAAAQVDAAIDVAVEAVARGIAGPMGTAMQKLTPNWPILRSLGVHSVEYPATWIRLLAARRAASVVLGEWLETVDSDEKGKIEEETRNWLKSVMSPPAIGVLLLEELSDELEVPIDEMIEQVLLDLRESLGKMPAKGRMDAVKAFLKQMGELLGGDPADDTGSSEAEGLFREMTNRLGDRLKSSVAELLSPTIDGGKTMVDFVRVKCDVCLDYFATMATQQRDAARAQERLIAELDKKLETKLPGLLADGRFWSRWTPENTITHLREYVFSKLRYRTQTQIAEFYLVIRVKLWDAVRDRVGFRQPLESVYEALGHAAGLPMGPLGSCMEWLLPAGSLQESAEQFLSNLDEASTAQLRQAIEDELERMWKTASSGSVGSDEAGGASLDPVEGLVTQAMGALRRLVPPEDTATQLGRAHPEPSDLANAVRGYYDRAKPSAIGALGTSAEVEGESLRELYLAQIPTGPDAEVLVPLIERNAMLTSPQIVRWGSDLVFLRVLADPIGKRIVPDWIGSLQSLYRSACQSIRSPRVFPRTPPDGIRRTQETPNEGD